MPTKLEYKRHLELLNDAAADEVRAQGRADRVYQNWRARDMPDLDHLVWGAVHQQGLMRQNRAGDHRLTAYGRLYLEQRS